MPFLYIVNSASIIKLIIFEFKMASFCAPWNLAPSSTASPATVLTRLNDLNKGLLQLFHRLHMILCIKIRMWLLLFRYPKIISCDKKRVTENTDLYKGRFCVPITFSRVFFCFEQNLLFNFYNNTETKLASCFASFFSKVLASYL